MGLLSEVLMRGRPLTKLMDVQLNSRFKLPGPLSANRSTVSVVIPTKNRKEQLRETICSVLSQTVSCEIIVIDDGSTDNTEELIRGRFPTVRYNRNVESRGPAASRNQGAAMASGEILVTLDDDCVFCRKDAIEICLQWLDSQQIAAVTLPFVNVQQDEILRTAAPDTQHVYATVDYYAGMVAFRKSAYLSSGGYRTDYFMHHEEPDLAIRLLERGKFIRNGTVALISHHESPARDRRKLWRLGARNAILYALFNIPLILLPAYLAATATKTFLFAVRRGGSLHVIQGFLEAAPLARQTWKRREPVSWKAFRTARRLKRNGPTPIEKVKDIRAHA